MTAEQLMKANEIQSGIRNVIQNITLLKEQSVIALISEKGCGKLEHRLNDDDVREVLIRHYQNRLETLEKEFKEL